MPIKAVSIRVQRVRRKINVRGEAFPQYVHETTKAFSNLARDLGETAVSRELDNILGPTSKQIRNTPGGRKERKRLLLAFHRLKHE